MSEESQNPNVSRQLGAGGGVDRLHGRESAYGLLLAAESPIADAYQESFAQTDNALKAARSALESRKVPPVCEGDELMRISLTPKQQRGVEKNARRLGLSVDEYLRTVLTGFCSALPDPPPGWKPKSTDPAKPSP